MDKNNGLRFPILPQGFRWHIVNDKSENVYRAVVEKQKQYDQYTRYVSAEVVEGAAGYPAEILNVKNVSNAIAQAFSKFETKQSKELAEFKFLGVVG